MDKPAIEHNAYKRIDFTVNQVMPDSWQKRSFRVKMWSSYGNTLNTIAVDSLKTDPLFLTMGCTLGWCKVSLVLVCMCIMLYF
jgi:hypothetical protein